MTERAIDLTDGESNMKNDLISRQAAIDATWFEPSYTDPLNVLTEVRDRLEVLPSAQPEEASMILGASSDGVRLWHQCSACGEPVDAGDNYCCNCGRKFTKE